jgi:hypothetical protein
VDMSGIGYYIETDCVSSDKEVTVKVRQFQLCQHELSGKRHGVRND